MGMYKVSVTALQTVRYEIVVQATTPELAQGKASVIFNEQSIPTMVLTQEITGDYEINEHFVVEFLTPKELMVIKYMEQGEPNKIIAHLTGMAENTVKVHIRNIFKKFDVNNRTKALVKYQELKKRESEAKQIEPVDQDPVTTV